MFVWTCCGLGFLVEDGSQGSSGDKKRVLLVDGDRQGVSVDGGRWDAGGGGCQCTVCPGVFGGGGHIGTGFWWALVVQQVLVDFFP